MFSYSLKPSGWSITTSLLTTILWVVETHKQYLFTLLGKHKNILFLDFGFNFIPSWVLYITYTTQQNTCNENNLLVCHSSSTLVSLLIVQ